MTEEQYNSMMTLLQRIVAAVEPCEHENTKGVEVLHGYSDVGLVFKTICIDCGKELNTLEDAK